MPHRAAFGPAEDTRLNAGRRHLSVNLVVALKGSADSYAGDPARYPSLPALVDRYGSRGSRHYRSVYESAVKVLPGHPTEEAFIAWVEALSAHGYAPLTVAFVVRAMNRLYEKGRRKGVLWNNPVADLDLPEEVREARPLARLPFTDADVVSVYRRICAVLTDIRERGMISVFRFTALREQEVLGLEAKHIDFRAMEISVLQQREADKWTAKPTLKRYRQRRRIPMHPELAEALRQVMALGPASVHRGHRAGPLQEMPYLFPFTQNRLDSVLERCHAVVEGWRGSGYAWHAWRHAWALEALNAGEMSKDDISSFMGHASSAITERYLKQLQGYRVKLSNLERLWKAQSGHPSTGHATGNLTLLQMDGKRSIKSEKRGK